MFEDLKIELLDRRHGSAGIDYRTQVGREGLDERRFADDPLHLVGEKVTETPNAKTTIKWDLSRDME